MLAEAPVTNYTITCTRFKASEVRDTWDMLFNILSRSGMYDEDGIAKLLTDCLTPNGLQMWVLRGETQDGKIFPAGCLITSVNSEPYSKRKWMVLLHVNSVAHISTEQWQMAYNALFEYANERDAEWLEVYTNNPRAVELLTAFGFEPAAYRKAV